MGGCADTGHRDNYQSYKDKGFNVVAINFRDEEHLARRMIASINPISYVVGGINQDWRTDDPRLQATPPGTCLIKAESFERS